MNFPVVSVRLCDHAHVRTRGQGHDSTQYGLGRASPQSFFQHHLAAVSCAIVRADALTIRNHAASIAVALAHGVVV